MSVLPLATPRLGLVRRARALAWLGLALVALFGEPHELAPDDDHRCGREDGIEERGDHQESRDVQLGAANLHAHDEVPVGGHGVVPAALLFQRLHNTSST